MVSLTVAYSEEKKVLEPCRSTLKEFRASHPEALVINDSIVPPTLVYKKEVQFPESVKNKKQVWSIIIAETVVSKTGSISEACIVQSKHPELDASVINAVKQWKYKPALKDGQPVSVFVTITVRIHVK
jgi:protein TonB